MTVENRIERVKRLLDKIGTYSKLVAENEFKPGTIKDMRGNVREMCNEIKAEIEHIKTETGLWG